MPDFLLSRTVSSSAWYASASIIGWRIWEGRGILPCWGFKHRACFLVISNGSVRVTHRVLFHRFISRYILRRRGIDRSGVISYRIGRRIITATNRVSYRNVAVSIIVITNRHVGIFPYRSTISINPYRPAGITVNIRVRSYIIEFNRAILFFGN